MGRMSDLPVVILAGGLGTRLSEETAVVPKPMIKVVGSPMLSHIMDIYLEQGLWNFFIPVGYKQEVVMGWFLSQRPLYYETDHHGSSVFQFNNYKVTVVDTGVDTMTGGRLLKLRPYLNNRPFHFTYGDGLGNVNLHELENAALGSYNIATVTAVRPAGRFGRFDIDGNQVVGFGEKVESDSDWVNGGFAVLKPPIFKGIAANGEETCNLERDVYPILAKYGYMGLYKHTGYWKCVDTLRDLQELEKTYIEKGAVWLKI